MSDTIKPVHIKKFRKLAKEMDALMREICAYAPKANLYIEDSWNANLLCGESHDDWGKPQRGNIVAHEMIYKAGGGGW